MLRKLAEDIHLWSFSKVTHAETASFISDDVDCRPKMTLLPLPPPPPPPGNFADIVYLKEQSFLHRIRDVCTL